MMKASVVSDSEAQGSWKSTVELLADLEGSEHFRPVEGREATKLTFTRTRKASSPVGERGG